MNREYVELVITMDEELLRAAVVKAFGEDKDVHLVVGTRVTCGRHVLVEPRLYGLPEQERIYL